MKLLLAFVVGAVMGIAPAVAQQQSVPLTPTEAYQQARLWPITAGKSRNPTPESEAAAEAARVRRARQYANRFNPEDWKGKQLYNLGLVYMIAELPEKAEKTFAAYLRDPAEDSALARRFLLWALMRQNKWEAATSVAKDLLDGPDYDLDADEYVRPLIESLRTGRLAEAIHLGEKRNLRLLSLVEGQKIDEGLAALVFEQVAQLGELYIESGNAARAEELFSSLRSRLQHSQFSANEMIMRHVESAIVRAKLLGKAAPQVEGIKYIDMPRLDIRALKGKVILLDFFAHWCGPCVESVPALNALKEKYKARGLVVVVVTRFYGYYGQKKNITAQQELTLLRSLKTERKAKPGFVVSTEAGLAAYGVVGYPSIALIDRNGKVRAIRLGAEPGPIIEGIIQSLLGENAGST